MHSNDFNLSSKKDNAYKRRTYRVDIHPRIASFSPVQRATEEEDDVRNDRNDV